MCVLYTENTTYCYNYAVVRKHRSPYDQATTTLYKPAHNLCSYTSYTKPTRLGE